MKRDAPHILLVNPWIHDFAAYDFWARPLGLLNLAGILRAHGLRVSLIDCLDRFHPMSPPTDPCARQGRGPYHKTRIATPPGLEEIPRHFCRYGIEPDWFRQDLRAVEKPDLILVTSLMTYWYPGVRETIGVIREIFPGVPLVLGGIYATLCREHAVAHSGADRVFSGNGTGEIFRIVRACTGYSVTPEFDAENLDSHPYPALDLQREIGYVPLLTSRGCPFRCAYCASHFLDSRRMVQSPERVLDEIIHWHSLCGVRDFVFYDDALLINADRHIIPLLEGVIRAGLDIRFHTPNAVHIREIDAALADLMFRSGFRTLRLGLETTAFEKRDSLDRKVTEQEFRQSVACLREAGFRPEQIGAYLLAGLPNQTIEALEASIITVKESGITPIPAYYTPIPHTPLWAQAVQSAHFDIASDPIFTNNAIFPCWPRDFSWQLMARIRHLTRAAA
ncbi:B12-binding domain-containing radical SAM protei n [Desulfonema ishimotonii]|uniref:B12-binding domain-containing radical SAM protei n n=1 Tax=Desulfonema ishimotonii TaxID=45657 RepID=A0A401G2U3_9BACT|nr:radical SAM protein [Desulfonema ishimotonii]GBC63503.1 B12-binding domain-containing radical SAM protei n [Desulfonema ishimotonii]